MSEKRDEFTKETKDLLASRVGYKCSFPNCGKDTTGPHIKPDKRVSIGEAAHITAAAPGGARYCVTMTSEERKSANNGIWMCRSHARLVDADEFTYPVELLKSWKYNAEYEQSCVLNGVQGFGIKNQRCKDAIRLVNKDIQNIHGIYNYFWEYYQHNLSDYGDFIEVNNKIMEYWNLFGDKLQNAVATLYSENAKYHTDFSEYELDLPEELVDKIKQYEELTNFVFQTDGVGLYENYYEKLFEMLSRNFNQMVTLINEISSIVREMYKR